MLFTNREMAAGAYVLFIIGVLLAGLITVSLIDLASAPVTVKVSGELAEPWHIESRDITIPPGKFEVELSGPLWSFGGLDTLGDISTPPYKELPPATGGPPTLEV